ncbi:MAG: hypothetical protein AAFQ53_18205, partial [Bacteroidota bacterium]
CGAPIAFVVVGEKRDGSPKWMPLDLASAVTDLVGERRAESHFAHCPNAKTHRARESVRRKRRARS